MLIIAININNVTLVTENLFQRNVLQ